jgi:hypothetical protein
MVNYRVEDVLALVKALKEEAVAAASRPMSKLVNRVESFARTLLT